MIEQAYSKSNMLANKVVLYLPATSDFKKQKMIGYCDKNNLVVVHIFEEADIYLKKPTPERPELCALIELLKYDVFEAVIIDYYSDIVRNKKEFKWLTQKVQQAGKKILAIHEDSIKDLKNKLFVSIDALEKKYLRTKKELEEGIKNCFFKGYPDQYSLVIGVKKCIIECKSCIDVIMPSKGLKEWEMDFDLFKKCVDYIPDNIEGLPVILCPGGETLTFKNLIPMIRYITDKKPKAMSVTTTNGILLTEKKAEELIDAGLSNFMISINAPNREEYKWLTGHDNYELIRKNVINLMKIREKKKSNKPFIRVQVFGIKRFEDKIEDFRKRWEGIVDAVEVIPVAFCSHIPEMENMDKFKKNINSPIVMTCNALFRHIQIYPDGTIFPCTCTTPPMKNYFPITLGNAREVNPFELWNSEIYKKLRERNLNGLPIMDECLSCDRVVSGDWTVVDTLEEDLFRKAKLKKIIGIEQDKK